MGKYEELLKKFFQETDFLCHSTSYEARTVLEFAQWLDKQSIQQGAEPTCPKCDMSLTSGTTQKNGKSNCPSCGASW